VFIIGGIRAGTTEKLGSYLEEYWEQVAGWRDRESGLDVKQIEVRFATILDVRIGEARGIRDEKVRVAPL
jgi:hypothetical protein